MKKVKAVTPRLSDEDPDPLEQDELDNSSTNMVEGWLPWDSEDILDIKRLINGRMVDKQKEIFTAFLEGKSHIDLDVSEKYWRYHFTNGIEFIKQELGL
jgi:hypothetical protein